MAQEVTFKIVWTEPAVCDLEKIDRYLRRRNSAAADATGEAILSKAGLLSRHPQMGTVWDEDDGWRVVVMRPYKIFYRILMDQKVIEISHIRHGARALPNIDDLLTD
ncbi:MAG: type II toxin-antitoxin system RelE/ParE family toxin [Verrucomicrobia bacterium]|nr:type II toxin-antitoxin system RelE/ParE family toxin [Verrucomicrobiota bacterium]